MIYSLSSQVAKRLVIAVDTEERTPDALALGRLLAESTGAQATVLSVFAYMPILDADGQELRRLREHGRARLQALARDLNLGTATTEVVPGIFAARELQRVSERP